MPIEEKITLGSSKKNTPDKEPLIDRFAYWWMIGIVFSGCLAIISWCFFTKVYQLPEKPLHYRLLNQFNQLKPAPDFTYEDIHRLGETLTIESFQDKFHPLSDKHLEQLNQVFFRNYLRQYKHAENVYFIEGRFVVQEVSPVDENSLLKSGHTVKLQALTYSKILHETKPYPFFITLHYPDDSLPDELTTGEEWNLTKRKNGLTIIKVAQSLSPTTNEQSWQIDTIPLLSHRFVSPSRKYIRFPPTNQFNL